MFETKQKFHICGSVCSDNCFQLVSQLKQDHSNKPENVSQRKGGCWSQKHLHLVSLEDKKKKKVFFYYSILKIIGTICYSQDINY